jgi:aspartyl-tRNA(Asn)/glutamyl-tRNA(Gln) amidotransferase subunit A
MSPGKSASEIIGKTVHELHRMLVKKEASVIEITRAHLDHIRATDKDLQSFNCLTEELALKQAADVDHALSSAKGVDSLPALAGIPIAVKDNMCVRGYPTTCSSKILENFVPVYDATVIERLASHGAIIIGKTNCDEFAMGSSTENSAFRITRNPWNLKRVPGGTSGGSAASVSAGQAVVSLGSDTGGSIRQPASFCGVVGMKPTYGTVSRYGLIAHASSLDQIGSFGRSVRDVATVLSVIAGHDNRDSTSYPETKASEYLSALGEPGTEANLPASRRGNGGSGKLRVGVISELLGEGIDEDVRSAIRAAADQFAALGASVQECSMPMLKHALPVYYIVATAEASANLARFDGVRYGHRSTDAPDLFNMYCNTRSEGFGAEVKRRIILGTYALSSGYYEAYYGKALQVRRLIKNEFDAQFAKFDILLCPTSPSVAFEIGAKVDDPLQMYLSDIATIPANLAGLPGLSLPCGLGEGGLPIGLQLLGAPLSDSLVIKAAHAYEQATTFHKQDPPALSAVSSGK